MDTRGSHTINDSKFADSGANINNATIDTILSELFASLANTIEHYDNELTRLSDTISAERADE